MKKPLPIFLLAGFLTHFSMYAATYPVTTTGDGTTVDGTSLRWAITQANLNPGADLINFNLGVGPTTISISTALPALTDNFTTIDGFDNAGFPGTANTVAVFSATAVTPMNAVYKVIIANTSTAVNTLFTITGDNNTIRGLKLQSLGLTGVTDQAVSISGKNNLINGCYIDMNTNNTLVFGDTNPNYGIVITGESNAIGNGTAAGANIFFITDPLSYNRGSAILITGAAAKTNIVRGNMIGMNLDGATGDANVSNSGIKIDNAASNNTVGGTAEGDGNVISGNSGESYATYGIYVGNATNTVVRGNIIGLMANGLNRVAGNSQAIGIFLNAVGFDNSGTVIGGNTPGARNVISDNSRGGIENNGHRSVVIQGNYIGTNKNGQTVAGSQCYGINLTPGNLTLIGGSGFGEGNVISGNGTSFLGLPPGGIFIGGSVNCIVKGNIIGLSADGVTRLTTNGQRAGIYLNALTASYNIIGGTTAADRNIISDNTTYGIHLSWYSGTGNNTIQGNYIGPDKNGAMIAGSDQNYGIYMSDGSVNNKIGGSLAGEPNLIAYNTTNGIFITDVTSTSNLISRNPIYGTSMTKAINLDASGNNNYAMPTITSATTILVSGTSATNGDIVEVFKTDGGCINALQYLGSATVAGNAWSVAVSLSASDVVIANVHSSVNNNTSEFTTCTVLPIELISFTGKNQGATNLLEWTTASEINNDYFIIERSADGMSFEKIGTVTGAGNSTVDVNYNFIDLTPFSSPKERGVKYYRLRQTDFNGDYTYSDIIYLANTELSTLNFELSTLYPNPATDDLNYSINSLEDMEITLLVVDVLGRVVIEKSSTLVKGANNSKINVTEIASGTYVLQVITANGLSKAQKRFSVK